MKWISYFWIVPFASFFTGYLMMRLIFHGQEHPTPALVGTPLEQALTMLSQANLNIRILGYKEDADLPAGTILSQTPGPDQKIKAPQAVFVVISKKPPALYAPAIMGKSHSEYTEILDCTHIRFKEYLLPGNIPTGMCMAQHPTTGKEIIEKQMIVYTCDGNQKPIIWPQCINKSVEVCAEFFTCHGIVPEIIHTWPTPAAHQCTQCIVIDQRPLAGSIIALNETDHLHVQLLVK